MITHQDHCHWMIAAYIDIVRVDSYNNVFWAFRHYRGALNLLNKTNETAKGKKQGKNDDKA